MNRALLIILATVTLDAIGIGLIMPILPDLLRSLAHDGDVTLTYGAMIALYAAMQFLCAPFLGLVSDRLGRRPVLIASLTGAAIDYLFMAFAPALWMLFVGRAVAGITAANIAVATAYIVDITPEADRARRFGYFHAMFGIGFIIGPVLGGVLGDHWLRAPFLAAAALNGLNALMAVYLLPESRAPGGAGIVRLAALNPLAPLRWALGLRGLGLMLVIHVLFALIAQVYGSAWVLYGKDRYDWNGTWVGLSLAAFGLCHAGAQAFLVQPVVARLGERRAMMLGVGSEILSLVALAFATAGWVVFALNPLFAVAGLGMPAFQALLTARVAPGRQGELQGVLSSLGSLTAVAGPLLFTAIYAATKVPLPGAVWLVAAAVLGLSLPLIARLDDHAAGRPAPAPAA